MKIKTTVDIPTETISDVLDAGFTGIDHWAEIIGIYNPTKFKGSYADIIMKGEGSINLVDMEDDDTGGVLNTETIERGLQIMADQHPTAFIDVLNETGDANTGDVLIQYACFGEIIFA